MSGAEPRWSTSSNHSDTTKFPDFEPAATSREHSIIYEESADRPNLDNRGSSPHNYTRTNGALHSERWHSRKDNAALWGLGHGNGSNPRHGRQKSLSDAFKTIRAKKGSMTANAHEIAEALKAPVSWKLVVGISSPPDKPVANSCPSLYA
jgi:solute carrier family 35 protein E1